MSQHFAAAKMYARYVIKNINALSHLSVNQCLPNYATLLNKKQPFKTTDRWDC